LDQGKLPLKYAYRATLAQQGALVLTVPLPEQQLCLLVQQLI